MNRNTAFMLMIVMVITVSVSGNAQGGEGEPTLRVGIFDSRAVAMSFWRSAEWMETLNGLHQAYEEAKKKGDEELVKELDIKMPGLQVRMHQQVFSTGSVTDVIKRIEKKLPKIAKKAGVAIIVPKWNIAWQGDGVEVVDVTDRLVRCFNPDRETLELVEQMDQQQPVPIEDLSMDPSH